MLGLVLALLSSFCSLSSVPDRSWVEADGFVVGCAGMTILLLLLLLSSDILF